MNKREIDIRYPANKIITKSAYNRLGSGILNLLRLKILGSLKLYFAFKDSNVI